MAVLTAQGISSAAIALLTRDIVLPRTMERVPGEEFAGSNGDTITVRVPQPGTAREQATPGATITYDDVSETPVDVTLKHLYHGKLISDEQASLELEDFGVQVTRVQVSAVATKAEDQAAAAINALTADANFLLTATDDDTDAKILAAREALSSANVPSGDRWLAVSPQVATRLLSVDKFVKVNESGADNALRNAVIGRIYGFTVVESNALTSGTACAYHMSGFVFANRVPTAPRGARESATASAGGVGLRQIFQYVPDKLSDASVLSTFAGASVVEAARVFKLGTNAT